MKASSRFVAGLVLGLSLSSAAQAGLKKVAPTPQEEKTALDLAALEKEAQSGDQARVVAALETIGKSKDPTGAPIVEGVLTRGGTAEVLDAALKAASKLKTASTSAAITPYVRHRSADIRQGAAGALLKTGGPDAVRTLTRALRSDDAMVRGIAATGLGTLAAHESLEDLFLAFDRGVAEAAASIGVLCKPEECERYAALTGKKPFDIMMSGFDQILFRAPKDMPDEQKGRIIGRMRELGTAEVAKYLADVADRWPADWSKKLKDAIQGAAHAAGGGR